MDPINSPKRVRDCTQVNSHSNGTPNLGCVPLFRPRAKIQNLRGRILRRPPRQGADDRNDAPARTSEEGAANRSARGMTLFKRRRNSSRCPAFDFASVSGFSSRMETN